MYRIWIEEVLGFQLHGDRLTVAPVIPEEWTGFEITYRRGSTVYEIAVRKRASNEPRVIELDGHPGEDGSVQLSDDGGIHKVTVWIPRRTPAAPARPESHPADSHHPGLPQPATTAKRG